MYNKEAFLTKTDPSIYSFFKTLPKISIITPSYNQGIYLEETIQSVINQNYPNIEYIIIDGGSSDSTIEVIKKYQDNISFWCSEKDKGTYDAINKGLEKMTGDYWCILNSDDLLLPFAINHFLEHLIFNPGKDWYTGGTVFIDEHSQFIGKTFPLDNQPRVANSSFAYECWTFHPSTFLSKEIYNKAGKFISIDIMDYEYWLRLEMLGYFPVIIKEYLSGLRYHSDCKSMNLSNIEQQKKNLLISFKKNLPLHTSRKYNREINMRIKEFSIRYYQSKTKNLLYNKQFFRFFLTFLNVLIKHPDQFLTKWYWGIFKRIFTGIKESEVSVIFLLKKMK